MMYFYVYKITDKKRKKYYIGSRSSELPPEQDLGKIYFSSSTNIKFIKEQKENPNRFKYEILDIFPDIQQALEYENFLLRKEGARRRKDYYNGRNKMDIKIPSSIATKAAVSYLGNLIKIARKEHGVSQEELAERINVSRNTLRKIEEGNVRVSIGSIFEACFVLGIPLMNCSSEQVTNLSKMLVYMNRILPERVVNRIVDDNF